jgi:heme-degrading monooxygenase HmoA
MTCYQKMLNHLVRMARIPGFLDHARLRAKELEKEELYAGISKDVARCLRERGKYD